MWAIQVGIVSRFASHLDKRLGERELTLYQKQTFNEELTKSALHICSESRAGSALRPETETLLVVLRLVGFLTTLATLGSRNILFIYTVSNKEFQTKIDF